MTQQLVDPPTTAAPESTDWTVTLRVLAAIIAVVVVGFGITNVIGFFMLRTDQRTTLFQNPVTRVQVSNTDGNIVIRAGTAQRGATVISRRHNSFRKAAHSEVVNGGVLQVKGTCRGNVILPGQCSVDFEIIVPPGTAVDITSTTGDVSVTGTGATVRALTNTGDIRVSRAAGSIRLTTDTGDVTAGLLNGGIVTSRSNTGDIRLSFTAAPEGINATTDIGDVRVLVPDDSTAYQVTADVDLGDQHIEVPRDAGSQRIVQLATNTGDVRMSAVR
jgi:putative adhesin